MKNHRATIVLYMHYALFEKGRFTEEEVRAALDISRSSFFRGLSDFRCFLAENRQWENLVYNSRSKYYYIEKSSC